MERQNEIGKTFASYQLAKRIMERVLVLTLPAVQSAWEEDLKLHIDLEWQLFQRWNAI